MTARCFASNCRSRAEPVTDPTPTSRTPASRTPASRTPNWDPRLYAAFAGPRARPAVDLLGRIDLAAPRLVYDLGCGNGPVTGLLARR